MTVKMSSEGDTSKNSLSEGKGKSEAEGNVSQAQDAKPENNTEKVDEAPKDAPPQEPPEKPEKKDGDKPVKSDDSKNDSEAASDKKDEKEKKSNKKNEKDKDDEEGSEKEEEESEKDDEDDKDVPLLDQPLEKSGKRERKNVQRFNESSPKGGKDKNEEPEGSGTCLGNIPRVNASISRFKNEDMQLLHKILFKAPGKNVLIKKNIKKFNGFEFKKDSEEYSKKIAVVQKCEVKHLKSICEMLDLQKTGSKEEIIERIMEFLMEPKDSTGKAVGGGRPKRTAAVRANNRGYSSHDNYSSDERSGGRSTRDKGRRSNLKDDSSSHSDEDFEPSDVSDEKPQVTKRKRPERKKKQLQSDDDDISDIESASTDEDSDFQEEPKSKRKKVVKANNKAKAKTPGRRGRKPGSGKKGPKAGKKKEKGSSEEEEEEESEHKEEEGSTSEDEPLVKKTKAAQPPTDEEIKTYVKEILEGANLEQITMKTVCQQVYAHYPDFDLAHKKDFIKTTVKSLIAT